MTVEAFAAVSAPVDVAAAHLRAAHTGEPVGAAGGRDDYWAAYALLDALDASGPQLTCWRVQPEQRR